MARAVRIPMVAVPAEVRPEITDLEQLFHEFVTKAADVVIKAKQTTRPEGKSESATAVLTPLLMDIEQVMTVLGVGRNTVYELVKSGKLPARKIGKLLKFRPADVEAFVDALRGGDADD